MDLATLVRVSWMSQQISWKSFLCVLGRLVKQSLLIRPGKLEEVNLVAVLWHIQGMDSTTFYLQFLREIYSHGIGMSKVGQNEIFAEQCVIA